MTRLLVSCRFAPASHSRIHARTALPVVESDGVMYESYAAGGINARAATLQVGHDTEPIGTVDVVAASGDWYHADCTVQDPDPDTLALLRPGVGISLGATALATDTDLELHLRRHVLCDLEHLAVCRPGERPTFDGARITAVRELADRPQASSPAAGTDWLAGLPDEWRGYLRGKAPGDIVELGEGDRVAYRWDGARFVAAHARAA